MNKTKKKILEAALQLFNTYGLPNVSQRKISDHLGISPGNLTYHFKKKENIEEALYFDLVNWISEEFRQMGEKEVSLQNLITFVDSFFVTIYAYRFVYLDIVHLMRNNDVISAHYKQLIISRKLQFLRMIEQFIDSGLFREAELPDEYEMLYKRIQIILDFYLSAEEITENAIGYRPMGNHTLLFMHSIYPYLTLKGKKQFQEILPLYE
ncbi:TetR/AcrR family transcriptional regulator [Flavobacterium sp. WV_118_3]|uniref:TetR/AcrR family transcriptional regulator n=1 Tax=Flavobacterium sp. WV_118_3 TaxID=3151764 RepID=UPI00321C1A1B